MPATPFVCSACLGTGQSDAAPCDRCDGAGTVTEQRRAVVIWVGFDASPSAADRLAAGLAHDLEHEDTIAHWTDGITGWHTTTHRAEGDSHRLGRKLSLFPASRLRRDAMRTKQKGGD